MSRRVVEFLTNLKERNCAAVVQLPCVWLVNLAIFVYFCPEVLVLVLVKEAYGLSLKYFLIHLLSEALVGPSTTA